MSKPPESFGVADPYDPSSTDFAELRGLLLGEERRRIAELERRLEEPSRGAEELAEQLPEAVALRSGRDRQLARALAPSMESAISESVRRNPREIATAIFPVLGPAIRKSLAEAMASLVASINRAVEHAFSFRGLAWRIEAWRTGTPYAQVVLKHALVYRVEQLFLIHAETGLLLAHAAPPELKVADADLVSGMLTAIQDFVSDSFKQEEGGGGRLRTFSVGELTVIVEPGPQAILAAVIRGQAPESLLHKLQDTLETVHLQFAAAFADFQGDTAPFGSATHLLEPSLETVLSHQQRRIRRRAAWLRWAIPLLLLAAFLGWRAWRAQHRFTTAVGRLEAEPGIQVVDARRGGGKWHFRGLKDPLAAEPRLILAGIGADTGNIEARWEPYLSLEPSLVVARATQALAVPSGVKLRLGHDTLFAEGKAPLAWAARVVSLPLMPPGVATLELSHLEVALPADLALLKERIEGSLVLFDVGSAAILPGERAALDSVAAAFQGLQSGTGRLGYRSELRLLGRADPTGSDSLNRQLSTARVAAVSALLIRLGIPGDVFQGVPLGTTTPLKGRDSLDQARVNRSVAFEVRVGR
jgi:OOP family OmpA-OmpF porin